MFKDELYNFLQSWNDLGCSCTNVDVHSKCHGDIIVESFIKNDLLDKNNNSVYESKSNGTYQLNFDATKQVWKKIYIYDWFWNLEFRNSKWNFLLKIRQG